MRSPVSFFFSIYSSYGSCGFVIFSPPGVSPFLYVMAKCGDVLRLTTSESLQFFAEFWPFVHQTLDFFWQVLWSQVSIIGSHRAGSAGCNQLVTRSICLVAPETRYRAEMQMKCEGGDSPDMNTAPDHNLGCVWPLGDGRDSQLWATDHLWTTPCDMWPRSALCERCEHQRASAHFEFT